MIVGVAFRAQETGDVVSLPRPFRHHHLQDEFPQYYSGQYLADNPKWGVHGFVDEYGWFYNRSQAARHAFRHGQTPKLLRLLYSEDVWEDDNSNVPSEL